ncbi:hypothetical protein AB0I60_03330 [Actinosynnema sp. NPDC050436]|uniref:hypothetical protein n=1 Tax=Actinosynnema sp. NPDC050436 TaxID=3155659 RepID=UPI0033D3BD9E
MTGGEKFTVNPFLHTALTIAFALALLVGGCGVLLTVEVESASGRSVECGSAVTGLRGSVTYDPRGERGAEVAQDAAACAAALGTRRAWGWPLTGLGGVGLIVVLVLARWVHPPPRWWSDEVKGVHR